jgi:hypothetical protein
MVEYTIVEYQKDLYDVRDGVRVCVAGLTKGQAHNVVLELEDVQMTTRDRLVNLIREGL